MRGIRAQYIAILVVVTLALLLGWQFALIPFQSHQGRLAPVFATQSLSLREVETKASFGCELGATALDVLTLFDQALPAFHRRPEEILFHVNPFAVCVRAGQELTIISYGGPAGTPILRASAEVAGLTSHGRLRATPIERWFGSIGPLPPACLQFCDQKIMSWQDLLKMPANGQPEMILVNTPVSFDPANAGWKGQTRRLQWRFGETRLPNDLNIKRSEGFVLVNEGPYHFRREVIEIMSQLKRRGARKVIWFYPGTWGLDGKPLRPPAPDASVRVVFAKDLTDADTKDLHDATEVKSARALFTGDSTWLDHTVMIPNSVPVLKPGAWKFDPRVQPDDLATTETSLMEAFDLSKVHLDKNKYYLVYGDSSLDWRPYFLLKKLRLMGFNHLLWLRGGLDELRSHRDNFLPQ